MGSRGLGLGVPGDGHMGTIRDSPSGSGHIMRKITEYPHEAPGRSLSCSLMTPSTFHVSSHVG